MVWKLCICNKDKKRRETVEVEVGKYKLWEGENNHAQVKLIRLRDD